MKKIMLAATVIISLSDLARDDPRRCQQIKIMLFIQTCLGEIQS